MLRNFISAMILACLVSISSYADEHKVIGDKFPKEVKVGDKIKFDRPSVGGRNAITVKVNGIEIKGTPVEDKVDGKVVIGGGKVEFEVEVKKAGNVVIEISIKPAGDDEIKEKHTIVAK